MITHRSFTASVGPTLASLFKFTGSVRGAVMVILENKHTTNQLTYKVQESVDGQTWTDKSFTVGESTAITFSCDPLLTHTFRLSPSSQHFRVMASGSLTAHVSLSYSTASVTDVGPEIYA